MTPGEAVVRAHRLWVESKKTGTLRFSYRHGVLKRIEHDEVEFLEPPESIRRADVPACPTCGGQMESRDAGAMWTCSQCRVKRTQSQLRRA